MVRRRPVSPSFRKMPMLVNADFSRRAIVAPDQYRWIASPQAGVERVMLDRLGGEKARATSIVRYAPGSSFPEHRHPGGEEILVLSGTFSEDGAHHPAGWYLRNPPGSAHRPCTDQGAIIFVKLWQMPPDETRRVRIDTRDPSSWQHQSGRDVCPLFMDRTERVALERLDAGTALFAAPVEGAEMLVLGGELLTGDRAHRRGAWLRLPAGGHPDIAAGARGVTLYVKTGRPAAAVMPEDGNAC